MPPLPRYPVEVDIRPDVRARFQAIRDQVERRIATGALKPLPVKRGSRFHVSDRPADRRRLLTLKST